MYVYDTFVLVVSDVNISSSDSIVNSTDQCPQFSLEVEHYIYFLLVALLVNTEAGSQPLTLINISEISFLFMLTLMILLSKKNVVFLYLSLSHSSHVNRFD